MNIIDLGLKFDQSKLVLGNTPAYIGLHNSGGIRTVGEYHQQHLDQGWAGLGYNIVVDLAGKVYKGRDPKYLPAGILHHNTNSFHICAIGNFNNMIMPDVQREAIKEVIHYYKCMYPTIKEVKGHKELENTDCPGKNYPLQVMKDTFAKGLIQVNPIPTPSPIQNKIFKLQHALNKMGIRDENSNRLVEDGWIGGHTLAALKKTTISRGVANLLVGWIQEQLRIRVDNIYGREPYHDTYDAIVKFQRSHGLIPDGIVGIATWTELIG